MDTLTTEQKGQIAFLHVQIEAAKKRAVILFPSTPVRYDLGLDYQRRFYRAQVKYADGKTFHSTGAVRLDLRRRGRCYSQDEIDVVLVYVPQIGKVCWLPPEVFHNKPTVFLRLTPAKNKQTKGCLMAESYVW
jgi:hypothetical protein